MINAQCNDESRPIRSVGIIGGGVMGRSIAVANAAVGIPVVLTDISPDATSAAVARAVDEARACGSTTQITGTDSYETVARADLIIEAVAENANVKKRVFQRLGPHLRPHTLVASNTSCLSISLLGDALSQPAQLCGLHFCHPVRERPLVEVVYGRKTSAAAVARAVAYAERLGKRAIVVKDAPGFVINRLLVPYFNEAIDIVLDGAHIEDVERSAAAFGMPVGPFAMLDAFGIDVAMRVAAELNGPGARSHAAGEIFVALYGAGRLGNKSEAGFYARDNDGRSVIDSFVRALFAQHSRSTALATGDPTWRLFAPMLLEATRVLEEDVVAGAADIDAALALGLGFSPAGLGFLQWADGIGAGPLCARLNRLTYLGPRFRPTPLLEQMAKSDAGFHAPALKDIQASRKAA